MGIGVLSNGFKVEMRTKYKNGSTLKHWITIKSNLKWNQQKQNGIKDIIKNEIEIWIGIKIEIRN